MKKLFLLIILFFTSLTYAFASDVKAVVREYKIAASDGFGIDATLKYPKIKGQLNYSTVVLLHSLGYSSEWWENLPDELLNNGYAVVTIDFRGHGKSVYNPKLARVSWKSLTNKAFSKYPDDVISVINHIKNENKRVFFDNWAIIGSDLGADTAIFVANEIPYKPKTIVMLSPAVSIKGLYVPVKLAELGNIDLFSIIGASDINAKEANNYLKKFAQYTYAEYVSESTATGMLMIKNDSSLTNVITSWINQYLK